MTDELITNYHADAIHLFRSYKKLAERAIEQVSDDEFFLQIDAESNSIAVLLKHLAGNMRSRWTDFLISDGEKPGRNRDTEFEMIGDSRESLMQFWESAWTTLFYHVESLTADDFSKKVLIRGEEHSVAEAINRQLTHYAYHIGQIVFLAKHLRGSDWKNLSVPRNSSAQFNHFMSSQQDAGMPMGDRFEAASAFANSLENENEPK